jgi:hypothetical protein
MATFSQSRHLLLDSSVRYDIDAVIPISSTTSAAVDTQGGSLVGLVMPAAFTGSSVTFQVSPDNVTFSDYYDTDGNAVTVQVGASRYIGIVRDDFANARYIKIVSGSTEAAERTITLSVRGLR